VTVAETVDDRSGRLRGLLEALGPALRREMRPGYGADSCIAAVRIGLDALARLGVRDAYPLRVTVMAVNRAYHEQVERHRQLPRSVEEREAWHRETGAHSVGLGFPVGPSHRQHRDPERFDPAGLHLVAVVERAFLWDPSLDQATRPEHDLVLEPLVVEAPFWFLMGNDPLMLNGTDGAVLRYQARHGAADNRSYLESPNWGARDAEKRALVVSRTLDDPAVRKAARRLAG
jgi:hypothetical protein